MKHFVLFIVTSIASISCSQECSFVAATSTSKHLRMADPIGGDIGLALYVPDSQGIIPGNGSGIPGIIFTHSVLIDPTTGKKIDLDRFAQSFARSGVAVAVIDFSMRLSNDRAPSRRAVACAGQILMRMAHLDLRRLAVAGTLDASANQTPICKLEMEWNAPCWNPIVVLNFGADTSIDMDNAKLLLTPFGQRKAASFLARHLGIRWIP